MKFPPVIFVLAAIVLPPLTCYASPAKQGPIWWRIDDASRTRDGGMEVALSLVCPDGMNIGGAEAVYISSPTLGHGARRRYGEPEIFRKAVSRAADGSISLRVYSGRPERIDLRGKFSSGGRVYYAQTVFSGYGESGVSDDKAEMITEAPDWRSAGLTVRGDLSYYRAQTGDEIAVATGDPSADAAVYENGELAAYVKADSGGVCAYTPPHDKTLSEMDYRAKKDVVFDIPGGEDGARLSLSIAVHRAFYGNTSPGGGMAVMLGSSLLGLSFVLYKGRNFRWR